MGMNRSAQTLRIVDLGPHVRAGVVRNKNMAAGAAAKLAPQSAATTGGLPHDRAK